MDPLHRFRDRLAAEEHEAEAQRGTALATYDGVTAALADDEHAGIVTDAHVDQLHQAAKLLNRSSADVERDVEACRTVRRLAAELAELDAATPKLKARQREIARLNTADARLAKRREVDRYFLELGDEYKRIDKLLGKAAEVRAELATLQQQLKTPA